jgi:hypothetical protein
MNPGATRASHIDAHAPARGKFMHVNAAQSYSRVNVAREQNCSPAQSSTAGMAEIDTVALAALIISIVALTSTLGQLLQQYFATADRYRRCLPSVMGRWGTKSERRWRWREFRFETIYFVPDISLWEVTSFAGRAVPISQIWHEDWRKMRPTRDYLLESAGGE